jgi:hypothetical protein
MPQSFTMPLEDLLVWDSPAWLKFRRFEETLVLFPEENPAGLLPRYHSGGSVVREGDSFRMLFEVGQPEELYSSALVLLVMKVPYQEENPAELPQRYHNGG